MDLFLINTHLFTSWDFNWWTGVVWITCGLMWCFIRCLDSHSDGTHSLQRIHWWTSDVMLRFSKSDKETKSSASWMAWVNFQQIDFFHHERFIIKASQAMRFPSGNVLNKLWHLFHPCRRPIKRDLFREYRVLGKGGFGEVRPNLVAILLIWRR